MYRYRSVNEDPVELDDSRFLDAVLHPEDAAEVKRRLDGPCSCYTPSRPGEPLSMEVDVPCPHDEPLANGVRIAAGAVIGAFLLAALMSMMIRFDLL